jgi:hypothetical protein
MFSLYRKSYRRFRLELKKLSNKNFLGRPESVFWPQRIRLSIKKFQKNQERSQKKGLSPPKRNFEIQRLIGAQS